MENKGDFVAGVFIGSIVGAVCGIMWAPAPGRETRARVAEKGKEVGKAAKVKMEQKSEMAQDVAKDTIAKLRERLPDSEEVKEAIDSVDEELKL